MVERIFTEMQNIADELSENKADYLQLLDQSPPLWTNVQKVIFQARIHELQSNIDSWNENVTKLESKANVMKNDNATAKQEMFTRIDTVKQTQRSLLKDVKRIILEGTGYLRVSILPPVQAVTPPPITPTILQIPALNIQKFNGDYLKWKPFWQRFEVNVDNRPFSNVEKLDALIGLLEGIALEEVAGFEIADENYNTVVKTLQQRFGNEKIVLKELYNKLRSVPRATSDAKSIRFTVNSVVNMCRQLENYGVDIDNDALQTEIIDKMPPGEKNELDWLQIKSKNVTTEMLLEKMKDIALKAEISTQNIFSTTITETYSPTSKTTMNDDEYCNSRKKFACSLCEGDHWTANCPQFTTIDEKIKQLELKNYCSKCARRSHNATQCRSSVHCNNCDGQHYAFICPERMNTTLRKINNSNTLVALGTQQGCLLTKKITLMNPDTHNTVEATVLFDAGSQWTFISDSMIDQLKLPRGAQEKLNLQGIGAKATNYISSQVKFQVKTTEDFEDIDANSIPKIANSVSVITYEENDPTKYTVTEAIPDILIGMDYFFTFITSFEKRNEIVIVNSKIGQMLSGNIETSQNSTLSSLAIETRNCEQQTHWKINAMGNHNKYNQKFKPIQHRHPRIFYNSTMSKQKTQPQPAEIIERLIAKFSVSKTKMEQCHGQSSPSVFSSQNKNVHDTKTDTVVFPIFKPYRGYGTRYTSKNSGGGECLAGQQTKTKINESFIGKSSRKQKHIGYKKLKIIRRNMNCQIQAIPPQQTQSQLKRSVDLNPNG